MASTVGTIMALLVFLTFLSLITNQYVPVWMKDSEAAHMGEALGQIGKFKSDIDVQILSAQTARQVRRHYIPVTTFSVVKLGVDGVPIFASPTIGQLTLDQAKAPWTVWFQYDISGNSTTVPEAACACGGVVKLHVYNRYYPQQDIAYESGAIIRGQFDGQIVKAEPSFQVLVTNTSAQIDFTLVEMFGSDGIQGVGSEGLQARVLNSDLQEYEDVETEVYINHTSEFGPAWYRYFNMTLADAYGVTNSDYLSDPDFDYTQLYDSGGRPTQLRADNPYYLVQSLWNPTAKTYAVTVQFKLEDPSDGTVVPPITAVRLQHAYVNVAVGDKGNELGI